jgi:hypothetical protein
MMFMAISALSEHIFYGDLIQNYYYPAGVMIDRSAGSLIAPACLAICNAACALVALHHFYYLYTATRIFKNLRSPGINSKESIPSPDLPIRHIGLSYRPARLHRLVESVPVCN